MSEWLPIESAPKDGTRIDVWVNDRSNTGDHGGYREPACRWSETSGWVRDSDDPSRDHIETEENWTNYSGQWREIKATHWMPLPPPPLGREVASVLKSGDGK